MLCVKGTPQEAGRHLNSSLGPRPGAAALLHFLPLGSYSPQHYSPDTEVWKPCGRLGTERSRSVATGLKLSAYRESAAGLVLEVTGFLGSHPEVLVEEVPLSARSSLEAIRNHHALRNRV